LNNGDGTFAAPDNYGVGLNPLGIAVADIDKDGDSDLAVVNLGSDTVSVLMNLTANDVDADGVADLCDNCPNDPNPGQADADGDGFGDVCDICPGFDDNIDTDGDGIPDGCDTCPTNPDPLCCCDLAGDANNDGSVNIADITFLIKRIFAGGTASPCCEEGDANDDGSVNIADVTYLIARIFAGGPAPNCGPAGMGC